MNVKELVEFFDLSVAKMRETLIAKNSDYTGGSPDPFANFTAIERMYCGVATEQGFMVRMTDKFMRIGSFVNQKTLLVKDESVSDTLIDLSNYCILFAAYLKSKKMAEDPLIKIPFDAKIEFNNITNIPGELSYVRENEKKSECEHLTKRGSANGVYCVACGIRL